MNIAFFFEVFTVSVSAAVMLGLGATILTMVPRIAKYL